jgi:hypothetical protein
LWFNALNIWPVGGLEAELMLLRMGKIIAGGEYVELIRIINKQLLLHLVECIPYCLYQRCTVKQISKKKQNVEIGCAASSGGQGKYMNVSVPWSPLEAALSVFNVSFFW